MDTKRTFYVSSFRGDDRNDGTSAQTAFRTLEKINCQERQPGDQILLERGSVFRNEFLHIFAGGSKEAPVVVDAYGEGDLPRIEAAGSGLWYQDYGAPLDAPTHVWHGYVSSAVLLYDAEYITLRNLEITNQVQMKGESYNQSDRMNRTGVSVIARDGGTLHQIELDGLYVHDVSGNVYDKHMNNGGIYVSALKPAQEDKTGIARYEGLSIHHCRVERCRRWGIAAGYTYQHDKFTTLEISDEVARTYGSVDVKIEHNRPVSGRWSSIMFPFTRRRISIRKFTRIRENGAAWWRRLSGPGNARTRCSSTMKPGIPGLTRTGKPGTRTPGTERFTSIITAMTTRAAA